MIEMVVDSVRVSLSTYQRVVILKEKEADRYLPIWIGPAEADAIAVRLQEVAVPRPLTHDLLRSVIEALGASVSYVLVNDLANDTFYAKIYLEVNGRLLEVDSRPSDAIALAVRVQAPIFAEESVLERAGVRLDEEGQLVEGPQEGPQEPERGRGVTAEELEKLSPFREVIESLNLEDLGKEQQDS
ncbi:MAG: bifunctional nuclease family protein [Dehalococcoidia bacterium]|nr:bifunctional nuclease family protein [Dehalococcoidia bacterium]MDW8009132.1 bifunctional nuclease family protein [Chloroflexota bacterium]HXG42817.1 bifunctional nuclease family protein [Dehalococcoidia bacterium]